MILDSRIEGVLFDIDDTLVDTRGAFAHSMNVLSAKYLPSLPVSRYHEVLSMWRADVNGYYRAYTRGELTGDQQRMARANELQRAFGGLELSLAEFEVWDKDFMAAFREGWKPFDDSRTVIDSLRSRGVAVGALSNAGFALQTEKMTACGLADVDILVTLDTFGVGKPDPRVFVEAARLLGVPADRVAYVGDEPDIDALGALRAGLGMGVWIDRPGTRRGGTHDESTDRARSEGAEIIASLLELL